MKQNKHIKDRIIIVIMIVLPIFLIILPKTQFDHGPKLCIYSIVSGKDCIGCGMTRAFMRLIHLDIDAALEFNALSIVVFPILGFVYLRILYCKLFKNQKYC